MVMKKYEEYIGAEVANCIDDCVDYDTTSQDACEGYEDIIKSIAHELTEDDELSVAIEKLVHDRVRRELDKRGVDHE